MKKRAFIPYFLFFFLALTALLAGIFSFFHGWSLRRAEEKRESVLQDGARHIHQHITQMLSLTKQDFQYLLENESDLLYSMLEALRAGGETSLFITNDDGKVEVASFGAPYGAIPSEIVQKGTELAREGKSFVSDLNGFFPEARLCHVVVLEKEYSESHRQRVGLVFLTLPTDSFNEEATPLLWVLFFSLFGVLVFFIFLAFFLHRRMLLPLGQLDEAAEAFAKGDFTKRLPEKESGSMTPLFLAYNQMAEKVEKNETIRQTFVSNVSHDLRTPLTTISGFVQNMLQGTIPADRLSHYYKIILDEVNRLSRLVQTLLETSRMSAGERKYSFAPMDLCELGRVTLLSFEKRLDEKNIEVMFFSEPEDIFVFADKDAIQQVVYNLLDNAIKFTPEAGRLSLEITQQDKKAFFAVTNSGEGIPEVELSHLFERFYKSDRSRGLDKKGMGLGLFIAKSVISAHGEEIWVESKEGSYTQFVFSLPLTKPVKRKVPLE